MRFVLTPRTEQTMYTAPYMQGCTDIDFASQALSSVKPMVPGVASEPPWVEQVMVAVMFNEFT